MTRARLQLRPVAWSALFIIAVGTASVLLWLVLAIAGKLGLL